MINALKFVKDFLVSLSILASMVFSPCGAEPFSAKNPDELQLAFNAVADVHVETNNPESYSNFEKILRGVKANQSADATVFLGDNTMNGQLTEDFLFFGAVGAMLQDENPLITLGNHDIGNGHGNYNKFINRYIKYHNFFLKDKIEKPYYCRVINGCYMIFIASDEICVNSFYMSDEQLEWFEDTMESAGKSGKPIFIFSHHPINYLENENSDLLAGICSNYDNVFNIHGHTHLSYHTYEVGNVVCVNLPRVTETYDYGAGIGVTVEVYENEVLIRERDFCKGEFLSETSFAV